MRAAEGCALSVSSIQLEYLTSVAGFSQACAAWAGRCADDERGRGRRVFRALRVEGCHVWQRCHLFAPASLAVCYVPCQQFSYAFTRGLDPVQLLMCCDVRVALAMWAVVHTCKHPLLWPALLSMLLALAWPKKPVLGRCGVLFVMLAGGVRF